MKPIYFDMYPTSSGWYVEWYKNEQLYSAGYWWTKEEASVWGQKWVLNPRLLFALPRIEKE